MFGIKYIFNQEGDEKNKEKQLRVRLFNLAPTSQNNDYEKCMSDIAENFHFDLGTERVRGTSTCMY